MIDTSKIRLTAEQVFETNEPVLVELQQKAVYEDGKPTDKTQAVAILTSAENNFEKVSVKIDEDFDVLDNETIHSMNIEGNFVRVKIEGFEGKLYRDFTTKETKITARAKRIVIADDTNITL